MRKVLISLVVVLFVFAATNVEAQIRVGAKGGLNVAKVQLLMVLTPTPN
jgi:hypothetical protein